MLTQNNSTSNVASYPFRKFFLQAVIVTNVMAAMGATNAQADDEFARSPVSGVDVLASTGAAPVMVVSVPALFADLCSDFNNQRPRLQNAVIALANSKIPPKLPGGFGLVRLAVDLGSADCRSIASYTPDGINLRLRLARSTLFFHVTTPDADVPVVGKVGAPQELDPSISADFDLEVTTKISFSANRPLALTLGESTISVFNIKPDSHNVTGDIAVAIRDAVQAIAGYDVVGPFVQDRQVRFDALEISLTDISRKLTGARMEVGYNPETEIVSLTMTDGGKVVDASCSPGYVWRAVTPSDLVCVTPAVRAQVRADNRLAIKRQVASGSDARVLCNQLANCTRADLPCKAGFVWRNATPDDYVCVLPQTRSQAWEDNRLAKTRRMDYESPVK